MNDPSHQPVDQLVEEYAGDQAQDGAPEQDEVRLRRSRNRRRAA